MSAPDLDAAVLSASDLVVDRGGRRVLEIESFEVGAGETVAVVGPNGAGKSTLLLALGTLLRPTGGTLRFRGTLVDPKDALAFRRRLGLVLAAPLLLDTSVRENVAAGLRFRGIRDPELHRRTDAWLERLGVAHLASRPAREVSSGEAQRVSLARALVLEPDILMLDEPFASVDPAMRAHLVDDLERLLAEMRLACIVVTHDIEEAVRLGHRLAVVVGGRLRQVDLPERVLAAPVDEAVARLVGVDTRIPGRVVSSADGSSVVAVDDTLIEVAAVARPGTEVLCCLRPEDIALRRADREPGAAETAAGAPATNRITGTIERVVLQGPLARVSIDCGPVLVAVVTRASVRELDLGPGVRVVASFDPSSVHLVPPPA